MTRTALSTLVLTVSIWGLLHGCGNSGSGPEDNDPFGLPDNHNNGGRANAGSGNNGGDGDGGEGFGEGGGPPVVIGCDPTKELCVDAGAPGFCSDGQVDLPLESCDDGNAVSGDGCTATCALEADFVCPTPGEMCVSTVRCGDDKITGVETCDDGNDDAGDGCDATCTLEPGWSCPIQGDDCVAAACGDGIIAGLEECEDGAAVPVAGDGCDTLCQIEPGGPGVGGAWEGWVCDTAGMACTATVCNDGTQEGDEPCDDGNQVIGDGCNTLCEVEPTCPPTGGACTSPCGDGLILPDGDEECDDGNTTDGDGCSSACAVEGGYECMVVAQALPSSITIPFVFRDFLALPTQQAITAGMQRHPDFQNGCLGSDGNDNIVAPTLDAQGKPANSGDCTLLAAPACTIDVGYRAGPGQCDDLDTCPDPVNESACDQSTHPDHPIAGHPGDPFSYWYRDEEGVNKTIVIPEVLMGNNGVYSFNPGAFFPLEGQASFVASGDEDEYGGNNYGFTSEVRYWFTYQGGEVLNFTGDDDLYVFINGKLALSIGNKHGNIARTMTLDANGISTCTGCGAPQPATRDVGPMTVGSLYEIAIFHAERQTSASNFNLSLTGFVKAKSECTSVCGDGVVTPDEECDDGTNNADDAYNGCTTTCERSAFCGDGTVNGPEACDDGVNLSQYEGCAPGCVEGPSCGDGIVQSMFEDCDDGVLAAMYGGCAPGCILGPRCGDDIVQTPQEECDDGNRDDGDSCDGQCQPEVIQ
jgi:fibro-slime domain-containing protein